MALSKQNKLLLQQMVKFHKIKSNVKDTGEKFYELLKEFGDKRITAVWWLSIDYKEVIISESAQVSNSEILDEDIFTYPQNHYDIWDFVSESKIENFGGDTTDYESLPRGRVNYNISSDTYEIYCGKWFDKTAKNTIINHYNLGSANSIKVQKDPHYVKKW